MIKLLWNSTYYILLLICDREDKLSAGSQGAWVVNISPSARIHKALPLSTLILQLDPPIYGKPALLTWSDVQVLFKQVPTL